MHIIKAKKIDGTEINLNLEQITFTETNHDKREVFHLSCGEKFMLKEESLQEVLAILYPVKKTTKNADPKDELLALFDKLHKLTGGNGVAVFTPKREKQLGDLMGKHRLTEELLITAATNIGQDAFLQGDNDHKKRYGDVDYLLRPEKAAKWSEEQNKKKKPGMFTN